MREIRGKCAYICIYIYIREGDFRGEEDTDDGVGSLIGGNNDAFCETTDWGHWSECSSTCGVGMKLRTRRFKDRMGRKRCPHVSLVEKVKCMEPPCSSGLEEQIDPTCKVFFTRVSSIPLQISGYFIREIAETRFTGDRLVGLVPVQRLVRKRCEIKNPIVDGRPVETARMLLEDGTGPTTAVLGPG